MADTESAWVRVATVSKPFGIRGGLRLHMFNPESDLLDVGLELRFEHDKKGTWTTPVAQAKGGGRVVLEGLDDRNVAEAWRGAAVFVRREDFPEPDPEEVFFVDLLGMAVVHENGASLGTLSRVGDNAAQPLLEVKTPSGEVVLVPFVPAFVADIDFDAQVLTLCPPDGLFDEDDAVVVPTDDTPLVENAKTRRLRRRAAARAAAKEGAPEAADDTPGAPA